LLTARRQVDTKSFFGGTKKCDKQLTRIAGVRRSWFLLKGPYKLCI
jgi:hypothetical protein